MKEKKLTVYSIAFMGLMAAVMCILGPLALPIGPVPISLTNLVVYFTVFVIGTKMGTGSYCLYLALGAVGLPVFSGYAGGLGKLTGPTGGYLIGFAVMALIGGLIMEKSNRNLIVTMVGWIAATAIDYLLGTLWFVYITNSSIAYALSVCVVPFIIGDIVKIILGTLLAREVRKGLMKAGVLNNIIKTESRSIVN